MQKPFRFLIIWCVSKFYRWFDYLKNKDAAATIFVAEINDFLLNWEFT